VTLHGRARLASFGAALLALMLLVASCSSGGDSSESKSDSESNDQSGQSSSGGTSQSGPGGGTSTAAFQPTGAEQAVLDYVASQGFEYIGDCDDTELPRDRGKWCSTLVEDGEDRKVYEVGPVGEEPEFVVTVDRSGHEVLTPGFRVQVDNGDVGTPRQLTPEELRADVFITGNLLLDLQAGIGLGLADLPPLTATPPVGGGTGGAGAGGAGAGGTGGGAVGGGGVTPESDGDQYPLNGGIVVENPDVEPGGNVVFRGGGCLPGETLEILFDGKQVGTLVADPEGNFAGSLKVPTGTPPGTHDITVRGSVCELNVAVTVLGGLAFTGASNDTQTTVLVGVAAVVLGVVLVAGSRRRRASAGARAGP
jgi:hypothetical protein